MRCYNFFLILSLFILPFQVSCEEYDLISLDEGVKSTGDIVEFSVEKLDLSKGKTLKNKRLNKLLYVLDVYLKNETVVIETIISEVKTNETFTELKDTYNIKKLNYKYSQVKLDKEFSIIDNQIILLKSKVLYFVLGFLIIILSVLGVRFFLIHKKKRVKIALRKKELNLMDAAITRDHIENIYKNKSELFDLYEFEEIKFQDLESFLNQIQFKKDWTQIETKEVTDLFKELIKNVRAKDGV